MKNNPLVYFETMGCQMNVADSRRFIGVLRAHGYTQTDTRALADLVVLNTCSVRERAESRAKQRIREYVREAGEARLVGRHVRVWVVGCMAQRVGDLLKKEIRGIDCVIGTKDTEAFEQVVAQRLVGDVDYTETASPIAIAGVAELVPVMRGCDNYCSYCIVPYVRGHEQSVGAQQVYSQIRELVSRGVREVMLLGQNVNSYRDGSVDFPALLAGVNAIDGLERIRFFTSHPKDCTDELIAAVAGLSKICNHFHLPVQAGSDRILGLMNRKYTRAHYEGLIEKIKRAIPDIDITTDIMVGFPGETESEFEETMELVKQTRFTQVYMFAYSKRAGTSAASMTEALSPQEKRARLTELVKVQTQITMDHYNAMVGKTCSVLVTERQNNQEALWMSQDIGCKRVLIACDRDVTGTILDVQIARSTGMNLIATPVK